MEQRGIYLVLFYGLLGLGSFKTFGVIPCPRVLGQVAGKSESGTLGKSGATFYSVSDRKNEDFHVTGVLNPDGTLKIGMYVANSNGERSDLDASKAVREILDHFGKSFKRVELKLSQFETIGDNASTREPMLDEFNRAWLKAAADPEVLQKARILGDTGLWSARDTIMKRAILSTKVGVGIAFSRHGLYQIQLGNTLGTDGKFVSVEIIFSKPN